MKLSRSRLAAALLSTMAAVLVLTPLVRAGIDEVGQFSFVGTVPLGGADYGDPNNGVEAGALVVHEVFVQNVELTEELDYVVVDQGTQNAKVQFSSTVARGQLVRIQGGCEGRGTFSGTIAFW
jgi:hypothetical protein